MDASEAHGGEWTETNMNVIRRVTKEHAGEKMAMQEKEWQAPGVCLLHKTRHKPVCTSVPYAGGFITESQLAEFFGLLPNPTKMLDVTVNLQWVPSPRHGASSGCGWRRRPPGMECSWEYNE
jgi:hypothetical protein